MRVPVLAICITGAMLIVSADASAQRPSSANDLASLKATLGPYVGKTCSVKVGFGQNLDEIVEEDGRIFVHHRYYTYYTSRRIG